MYKEPDAMKEIHEIREQMYEEQKKLSTREVVEKIHKEAEAVKKKYGLKIKQARTLFA